MNATITGKSTRKRQRKRKRERMDEKNRRIDKDQ